MPIVFNQVGFEWPNGKILFENINLSLQQKIYALVGSNGSGKSSLARLIEGSLEPSSGSVIRQEKVAIFYQLEEPQSLSVQQYLGADSEFIAGIDPNRSCQELSGGEWARVRLAKAWSSEAQFIILDEPTNHLDQEGRNVVADFITQFPGGILLISHDREFLKKANEILEISKNSISVFGGGWDFYEEQREQERLRLQSQLIRAKKDRDRASKKRQKEIEKQQKRIQKGKRDGAKGGIPKILRGALKRRGQETMGRIEVATQESLNRSVSEAWEAYTNLKFDPVMYAKLPQAQVSSGRMVLEAYDFNFQYSGQRQKLWKNNLNFSFRTPARIAIKGANGSGKSTLLRLLKGENLNGSSEGHLRRGPLELQFLDQSYSMLKDEESILENVQESSNLDPSELRSHLAMFLFQGDSVYKMVKDLSGGERLRVALAMALLRKPPAQALFLDEPTNNLDLQNIEFLENFLGHYQGALVVISHDNEFLRRLNLNGEFNL